MYKYIGTLSGVKFYKCIGSGSRTVYWAMYGIECSDDFPTLFHAARWARNKRTADAARLLVLSEVPGIKENI